MQKITTSNELNAAIAELELVQLNEEKVLREQFHLAYEGMKPINLIKSAFQEVTASQEIKSKVLTTTVGLAAGFVSKKLFEGVTHGPLRKLFGTALMFGITEVIARNPEGVKAFGKGVLRIGIKALHREK